MKTYFAYVRVSTVKQGEGVSLEAQTDKIKAFAEQHGLIICAWWEEKVTAAKRGRPAFNEMLKALRAKKADGVIFHKIDRSARNFVDYGRLHELADAGVDIRVATDNIDFTTRGGRLTADIQAVFAADYVRNLREECVKGMRGRLKQGLTPFGAPLGYLNNGKGNAKTIDPLRGPLVRTTFELYATGQYSLHGLREEMTKRGLRSTGKRPLTKRAFESMLDNPFYCGIIRLKSTDETFTGIHEKLISPRLFSDVQEVRKGRAGKKHTKHLHTYRGLFECGLCGRSMIPERQRGHVYYRCQTRSCATKCVREEVIEEAVDAFLRRYQIPASDQKAITAEFQEWLTEQSSPETVSTTPMQLAQVQSRLDKLTDALLDELIDKPAFNERRERLLLEKAHLEEKAVEEAQKTNAEPSEVQHLLEHVNSLAGLHQIADPEERREHVRNMLSNRRVIGKDVELEPSNWLVEVEEAGVFPNGEHHGPSSRSHVGFQKIQKLAAKLKTSELSHE